MNNRFFYIITGPTGVGKTDIALKLAERMPCEIVNADMGQLYAPLTIGTAKPDWKNHPVPHHLFDVFDTPRDCTVWEFRTRIIAVMEDIWQRKRIPLVVGGSGFYIKSLFFPPAANAQEQPIERDKGNVNELWEKLYGIDPERALSIHKNDIYRIKRALHIWQTTGIKPSLLAPQFEPIGSFHCSIVIREIKELYERIDKRVIEMIEQGWIDEVKKLQNTEWEKFLHQKKIIGYDVILEFLKQDKVTSHAHEMIALIQQKTRNYAKRQMTFFRSFERHLKTAMTNLDQHNILYAGKTEMTNLTLLDLDLYLRKLINEQ